MTFDYELKLFTVTHTENDMGDSITAETEVTILCDVRSVNRSEHYAAASNGMKPEITFIVNQYEYTGQSVVEYDGKRYKVIRDFRKKGSTDIADFETIELICEGV